MGMYKRGGGWWKESGMERVLKLARLLEVIVVFVSVMNTDIGRDTWLIGKVGAFLVLIRVFQRVNGVAHALEARLAGWRREFVHMCALAYEAIMFKSLCVMLTGGYIYQDKYFGNPDGSGWKHVEENPLTVQWVTLIGLFGWLSYMEYCVLPRVAVVAVDAYASDDTDAEPQYGDSEWSECDTDSEN